MWTGPRPRERDCFCEGRGLCVGAGLGRVWRSRPCPAPALAPRSGCVWSLHRAGEPLLAQGPLAAGLPLVIREAGCTFRPQAPSAGEAGASRCRCFRGVPARRPVACASCWPVPCLCGAWTRPRRFSPSEPLPGGRLRQVGRWQPGSRSGSHRGSRSGSRSSGVAPTPATPWCLSCFVSASRFLLPGIPSSPLST